MIKTLKNIVLSLTLIFGFTAVTTLPVLAATSPASSACSGLSAAYPGATCDSKAATSSFGNIIRNVINLLSVVVGAASVIVIIIGGFRYVISNGDSNGVSGAKNSILYAIVGLVIVLFAQVIVRFVLTNLKK